MIDAELRPLISNRIYGCDGALAICPWNKHARACRGPVFCLGRASAGPRLAEARRRSMTREFRWMFAGSAIKRIPAGSVCATS